MKEVTPELCERHMENLRKEFANYWKRMNAEDPTNKQIPKKDIYLVWLTYKVANLQLVLASMGTDPEKWVDTYLEEKE